MPWFKSPVRIPDATPRDADQSSPWTAKSWGKTRRILQCRGMEIWEAFGQRGHRTSLHNHPKHRQTIYLLNGTLEVVTEQRRLIVQVNTPVAVSARVPHELRFLSDCHFIEVYRGRGDVMRSIRRIYQ